MRPQEATSRPAGCRPRASEPTRVRPVRDRRATTRMNALPPGRPTTRTGWTTRAGPVRGSATRTSRGSGHRTRTRVREVETRGHLLLGRTRRPMATGSTHPSRPTIPNTPRLPTRTQPARPRRRTEQCAASRSPSSPFVPPATPIVIAAPSVAGDSVRLGRIDRVEQRAGLLPTDARLDERPLALEDLGLHLECLGDGSHESAIEPR